MKKEMSSTIPIEFTPNCTISLRYCLKNILIRSGRAKVRPISMMYFPTVVMGLIIIVFTISCKSSLFCLYKCKRSSDFLFCYAFPKLF